MNQVCEMCGQPASSSEPSLCAECNYKYSAKNGLVKRLEILGVVEVVQPEVQPRVK